MIKRYLLPLAFFLSITFTLGIGLWREPQAAVPSPLVGKPAPAFNLTLLDDPSRQFSPQQLKGQVWLLNVWASWCTSCRKEHPLLLDVARQHVVPIVGFNYQDQRDAGRQWLQTHGNPYQLTVFDADGRIGMDYGVYGVPETFVIDKQGRIRYKQAGVITEADWKKTLLPLIKELQRG